MNDRPRLKIAVTGGAGHFGQTVIRRLVESSGVRSVISLDVLASAIRHEKLESVIADVRDADFARYLEGSGRKRERLYWESEIGASCLRATMSPRARRRAA